MKVAVTPAGFDNIKSVLQDSQVDVEICDIPLGELANPTLLANYSVVFINCNSDIPEKAKKLSSGVASYVKNGGVVYASDYAAPIIQNMIPGSLSFSNSMGKMSVCCDVLDQGLQSYLNAKQVEIDFNMGGWYRVEKTPPNTKIFLEEAKVGPVLCQIPLGQGTIFYTAFHNDAQTDLSKNRMVEFLAIRPLLEQAVSTLVDSLEEQRVEIRAQQIANLRDNETQKFSFELDRSGRFRLIFQPTYQARLKIDIDAPGHKSTDELNVPGYLECDPKSAGTISVTIKNLTKSKKGVPLIFALTDNWGGTATHEPEVSRLPERGLRKVIGDITSSMRRGKKEMERTEYEHAKLQAGEDQKRATRVDQQQSKGEIRSTEEMEKSRIRQTHKVEKKETKIKTTMRK